MFKDKDRKPTKWSLDNIVWKNLFKMDKVSMLFLIIVVFMIWGYTHDIQECKEVVEDPAGFCDNYCQQSFLEGGVYESKDGIIQTYFDRLEKEKQDR